MADEILKALLTTTGALAVAWTLYALKEGGRRRLQRREIVEELELANLLDSRPDAAASLNRRVDRLLDRYLAPPVPPTQRRFWIQRVLQAAGTVLAAVLVVATEPSWWQAAALVVPIGLIGAVLDVSLERSWARRDADRLELLG